jgi:glycosyltransferase involved in cell wall biosynthesis
MKVWYLPLEPYRERYTELLEGWTVSRWRGRGLDVEALHGPETRDTIRTGRVLDAHGRCAWALSQTAALIARLPEVQDEDVIYVEDMFHPGWEALPYVLHQTGQRPRVFTRNYAQSVDVHDFTFQMRRWMRSYELMVDRTATAILCASSVHADEMRVGGFEGRIEVVGLPFDADDVRRRAGTPPGGRLRRAAFASRFDPEKQPLFMLRVAAALDERGWETWLCTAADEVRSSDPTIVEAVLDAERGGLVQIERRTTKARYYQILAESSVLLNTSLQDYVSFALLEASALGTPAAVPAYKSFPEVFAGATRQMYRPWDAEDAADCATRALKECADAEGPAAYHHGTLDRVADLIEEGR